MERRSLGRDAFALAPASSRALVAISIAGRVTERGLLVGSAVYFLHRDAPHVAVLTITFGVLAVLRAGIRAPMLSGIRRRFTDRVAVSLLEGRRVLTREEPREVAVFEGLAAIEACFADALPALVADGFLSIGVAVFLVSAIVPQILLTGAFIFAVLIVVTEVGRRLAERAGTQSYEALMPLAIGLDGCVSGALEIAANGRIQAQRARIASRAARWTKVTFRSDWLAGLAGRAPLALGFAAYVAYVAYDRQATGKSYTDAFALATFYAALLSPAAGVLSSVFLFASARPKIAAIGALLAETTAPVDPSYASAPNELRLESVQYIYPDSDTSLGPFDLAVNRGCLVALAGPNGAGKSTALLVLAGLATPKSGRVLVDGNEKTNPIRTAYLAPNPYFPPDATIRAAMEHLAEGGDEAFRTALAKTAILPKLERRSPKDPLAVRLATLSHGEQKRVALARLLLAQADLFLLDEPDDGLDREGQELLKNLLRGLSKEQLVVFVAHDEALLAVADAVIRLV